jgi:hypothetical protein
MKLFFVVPVAPMLLAWIAVALPIGASAQTFAAKPGAWDMTTTIAGNIIPPDVLAKMPPDRRAMVEKMMAEKGIGNNQPSTRRSCVTKEDLDRADFGRSSDANCTSTPVSRSTTRLVVETSCGGPPPIKGTMTFEAKTPESVVGSIDQVRPDGSKFHIGIIGQWVGASCEGIPPVNSRN